jgi:hypothetical protein
MATKWQGGKPPLHSICTCYGDQGCDDNDAEHGTQTPKKDVHAHRGPPFDRDPQLSSKLRLTGLGSRHGNGNRARKADTLMVKPLLIAAPESGIV